MPLLASRTIVGPSSSEFPENSTAPIATYELSDTEVRATVSWDIDGTDARRFTIDGSGTLKFKAAKDYEKPNDSNRDNAYEVEIVANADGDSHSIEVVVTITNVNEPPVFALEKVELSVTENAPARRRIGAALAVSDSDEGDAWRFSLAGKATGEFDIDAEGQIRVRKGAILDYEQSSTFSLIALVTDKGGLTDSLSVSIKLRDADDPGIVTFVPRRPFVSVPLSATISDDDGVAGRIRWRWYRARSVDDEFRRIDGATRSAYTPAADDENYLLRVTVTYEDNFESQATTTATTPPVVTNEAPVFLGEEATYTVLGQSARGTDVGKPVTAADADGDPLTYTLSGDDSEYFAIGTSNGQLTVAVEQLPSAATKASYRLIVTATDEAGEKATLDVLVTVTNVDESETDADAETTVTNVNEAPVITGLALIKYPENGVGTVATYTASDPESDAVTWSLVGIDAARFTISASGELSFKAPKDYEKPNDGNKDNIYEVTVRASDGNLMSTLDVLVTVTNVNEALIISGLASINYPENSTETVGTYTASDPESDAVTWSLAGTDAHRFTISTSGELAFRAPKDYEKPNDGNKDNIYEVTVHASDGNLASTLDVLVTVTNMNEAPIVTGTAMIDYPENGVGTVATYTASDPESDAVTWSAAGTDAHRFTISASGELAFKASKDYEKPNDGNKDNVYEVTVRASDGNLMPTLDVLVTVTNVNEAPIVTGTAMIDYPENGVGTVATYTASDPESGAVTWSLAGTDAARFTISTSGELAFKSPRDYEKPNDANKDNIYEVTVRASDGNLMPTLDVVVTVTNVNEAPIVTGTAMIDYPENGVGTVATYTASDPESDAVTWSLAGTDAHRFTISASGELSFKASKDYENPNDGNKDNIYEVTVRASDGNLTSTLAVLVTVTNVDEPETDADAETTVTNMNEGPVITGLASIKYAENSTGTVGTYTASDPESGGVTWSVAGTDSARFTISTSGELSFKAPKDYEKPNDGNKDNIYEVTVRASDGNLTSTLNVLVTVTNVNETPAITGLAAINYPENGVGTVATYTASDPESGAVTWSLAGTDAARFTISTSGELSFKASKDYEKPNDGNKDNIYEVTVHASDGNLTSTLDVLVTVTNVNEAPAITGLAAIKYPENGVGTVATYTASDPEDGALTWSVAGTDAHRFTISASGELAFKSPRDYEKPNDANKDNIYEVTVHASDGNLMSALDVLVTVTNVNEALIISGLALIKYPENGVGTVGTYTASDPESDAVTWSVAGTDAARFTISDAGELNFKSPRDYEKPNDGNKDNEYEVTVRASDGNLTSTLAVLVTVTNVNETPAITGLASIKYAENSTGTVGTYTASDPESDDVTWSLAGTDAARFTISTSGELAFKASKDYENPNDGNKDNIYEVTVRASDGNLMSALDVLVTVTNVNETPAIIGLASIKYPENSTETVGTYTASDPESGGVTWSVAGTDAHRFTISASGELAFKAPKDYENPNDGNKDNIYEVTVRASDGNLMSALDVLVTVTNVNEALIISGLAAIKYPENGVGTVATYTASDPESGGVTWSVAGTDAHRFTISASGELAFKSPRDYEKPNDGNKDNDYEVTVRASDGNLTSTLNVLVTVTNVDEPETDADAETTVTNVNEALIIGLASIKYAENGVGTVATYTASDPESGAVTWSLIGTDAHRFTISDAGELNFKSPRDYEKPNDGNKDNVYEVTVRASDGNLTSTLDVLVTVTNVDEPETDADAETTVTNVNEALIISGLALIKYPENSTETVGTYTASDPESDDVTWSVAGTDAARFTISASGELAFKSPRDYEKPNDGNKDNIYEVTVRASDGNLMSALDVLVTVTNVDEPETDADAEATVTNVNEGPVITGLASIKYAENGVGTVATYTASDPEDGALTWSLIGTDAARFTISTSGELAFRAPKDYEKPNDGNKDNIYEVTVRASDGNLTSTLDVLVTVTNVNEAPAIIGLASIKYPENSTETVGTYTASDPESDDMTWSVAGTDAARFTISTSGELSFKASKDYEKPNDGNKDNEYEVTVRASDGNLMPTLDVLVTVTNVDEPETDADAETTVTNVNEGPVITGLAAIKYPENSTETVGTYTASDPEDGAVTWSLIGTDAARFTISTSGGLAFRAPKDYEKPNDGNKDNVYEVTVRASDGNLTSTLDVLVTVTNVNEALIISGLAAIKHPENGVGTVATYTASDPESDAVTWSVAGTDAARFTISASGELAFKSPRDYEKPNDGNKDNEYEVTVRASDGNLMSTLDVLVTVTNMNEAPVITGLALIKYPENSTETVGTYTASDPESDAVTWSVAGTDAARFTISASGELAFKSPRDYEKPNDGNKDNEYEVTVRASDGNLMSALDVLVTVTNVNEAPAITGLASIKYSENNTGTVGTYTASDPESDDVTWSLAGTDAARFIISTSGELSFKSPRDYEKPNDGNKDNIYEVTVRASDGNLTSTLDVLVTVTNVDEPETDADAEATVTNVNEGPVITGLAAINYPENSVGTVATYTASDPESDAVTWSMAGTDAARFTISTSGELAFKASKDYEKPNDGNKDNEYEVTVRASDGNLTSTLDVVVTVTNVDEPETDADAEATVTNVNEALIISGLAAIKYPENGVGTVATYTASDPEGDGVTWSVAGTDAARFTISDAGELNFKSPRDYENPNDGNKDNIYEVTVRASDGNFMSTLDVVVTVTNVNEAPAITGLAAIKYPENGVGTVATYTASDPEGDAVTWSLAGTDAHRFTISASGELSFKASKDYEKPNDGNKDNEYEVTVRASDGNLMSTLDVVVTVTNVNEGPVITGLAAIKYPENGVGTVGTYTASDPESDAVTWSVAGTDAARFKISTSGELAFKSPRDYEKPNDGNKDNIYEVTVRASDGNLTSTLNVLVTVTNVNEALIISGLASIKYAENSTETVGTYTASDPESGAVTWSLAGTDAHRFTISTSGELAFKSPRDYEKPNDGNKDNVYEVTVHASDGNLTSTLDVLVTVTNVDEPETDADAETTVTNVNEAPIVTGTAMIDYPENGVGTVATYTASDPESGAVTWSLAGTDAARFKISTSGELAFKSPRDYEKPNDGNKDNIYEVTVRASDGNLTSTLDVLVTVTKVNEAPAIIGLASINYPENSTGTVATYTASDPESDAVTWSVAGTDAARFTISTSGELAFKAPKDYENPNDGNKDNIYEVTVRASDGNLMSALDVLVTVTNVNETPAIIGLASIKYPENSTETVGTYTASDPESDAVTWSLAGTDAARFTISTSGELAFKSPRDYEKPNDGNKDNIYEVTVRASDGNLTSTLDVVVTVTNVNEAPRFPSRSASAQIPENSCPGAHALFRGIDEGNNGRTDEDGDLLTYVLSGPDANAFVIHAPTGYVTLGPGVQLDFENGRRSFSLQVAVSDGRDDRGNKETEFVADDHLDLMVVVVDVDEPPVYEEAQLRLDPCGRPKGYEPAQLRRSFVSGSSSRTLVGAPVTAIDPEGKVVSYSIAAQSQPGAFILDEASGHIMLGPDFPSQSRLRVYTLRISATDAGMESHIEVRVEKIPAPQRTPEPDVSIGVLSRNDPPEEPVDGPSPTPGPASSADEEHDDLDTGSSRGDTAEPSFVLVENAVAVPQFGKAVVHLATGRARLVAPAGTLASPYQVRLVEEDIACSYSTSTGDVLPCVCISVEFFDVSGAPLVQKSLNRAALLEIVLSAQNEADTTDEKLPGYARDSMEMVTRPDPLAEWVYTPLNLRESASGLSIATTRIRGAGQYMARQIDAKASANPAEPIERVNVASPDPVAAASDVVAVNPFIERTISIERAAAVRPSAYVVVTTPGHPLLGSALGLLSALLLDVTIVLAVAAILRRLIFQVK